MEKISEKRDYHIIDEGSLIALISCTTYDAAFVLENIKEE